MKVKPVPPGLNTYQRRRFVGAQAEDVAADALKKFGYKVTNLNRLGENCPFMDLTATQGDARLIVQVKGTTIFHSKWGAPEHRAVALDQIARALGCHGYYAFVWMAEEGEKAEVRLLSAKRVKTFSKAATARYTGTLRYHIHWDDVHDAKPVLPGMPGIDSRLRPS